MRTIDDAILALINAKDVKVKTIGMWGSLEFEKDDEIVRTSMPSTNPEKSIRINDRNLTLESEATCASYREYYRKISRAEKEGAEQNAIFNIWKLLGPTSNE